MSPILLRLKRFEARRQGFDLLLLFAHCGGEQRDDALVTNGQVLVVERCRSDRVRHDLQNVLRNQPVLMLLDRRPDVFLARRSGAEGFVVKPLDPQRVRRAVRALLRGETFEDDAWKPATVRVGASNAE